MIGVQGALKFNGGGHVNHSIFWTNLAPSGGGKPKGRCICVIVCICITQESIGMSCKYVV